MKRISKGLISLVALGAAGVLAAGCGSSSSTTTAATTTAAATTAATTTAAATTAATTTAATTTAATTVAAATTAATTVAVSADPSALAFDKTAITVPAGKVTFDFNNPAPLQHNFSIRAADGSVVGASDTVTSQAAAPFTVNLKPGTYIFFCSVSGHEAAGMKGTLTVK
jgi:plastocyanin